MRVLRNLPRQRLAVGGRHPVVRLDPLLGIDARLKLRSPFGVLNMAVFAVGRIERLRIHGGPPGICWEATYNIILGMQYISVTYLQTIEPPEQFRAGPRQRPV